MFPLHESIEDQIKHAMPTRTGKHDLYAIALRLVSERHAKHELVALVNWLLFLLNEANDVNNEMHAKVDELADALSPMVEKLGIREELGDINDKVSDRQPVAHVYDDNYILLGDVRRARSALARVKL